MPAVLLALGLPTTTWAAPVGSLQIFVDPLGDGSGQGNTLSLTGPVLNEPLPLRFNASTAEGGVLFSFGPLIIIATGTLQIEMFDEQMDCLFGGCFANVLGLPGSISLGTTGLTVAEQTGVHDLAILRISGLSGTVEIQAGGNYTPFDFTSTEFAPFVLATVTPIPEPGTLLLLGVGLGGLAYLRRRSS